MVFSPTESEVDVQDECWRQQQSDNEQEAGNAARKPAQGKEQKLPRRNAFPCEAFISRPTLFFHLFFFFIFFAIAEQTCAGSWKRWETGVFERDVASKEACLARQVQGVGC